MPRSFLSSIHNKDTSPELIAKVDAYRDRYKKAWGEGNASQLKQLHHEIIQLDPKELEENDPSLNCEVQLIAGDSLSIISRWKGDIEKAEEGRLIMSRSLRHIDQIDPFTRMQAYDRIGNSYTRTGFLKRSPDDLLRATRNLQDSKEYLMCNLKILECYNGFGYSMKTPYSAIPIDAESFGKLGENELKQSAAEINSRLCYTCQALGEAYIGQALFDPKTFLNGTSVANLKIADRHVNKENDLSRILIQSGLALAQAIQISDHGRVKTAPAYNLPEDSRELSVTLAREVGAEILRKEDHFRLARPCIYIAEAAIYLFSITGEKDHSWLELGLNVLERALHIYNSKDHFYRQGIVEYQLGLIHELLENFEESKWHFEYANHIFTTCQNERKADSIQSLIRVMRTKKLDNA